MAPACLTTLTLAPPEVLSTTDHHWTVALPSFPAGRSLAAKLPIFQASRCPLAYLWPPGRSAEPYLGAAHGLIGILYVLLHCREWLQHDVADMQDIQDSLRWGHTRETGCMFVSVCVVV